MNSSTWTRIIRFHFCYRNIVLFLFLWEFSAFTPTDAVNGVAITHSDTRKKNIKIPRTHRKSSLNIIIYRHHTPNETCYTFTHSRRTHISATTHSVHMAGLRNSHIKQQYFFFFLHSFSSKSRDICEHSRNGWNSLNNKSTIISLPATRFVRYATLSLSHKMV